MQHPIGAHALLADGRTAALVAPDGDVAWLCWPRIDSPPCLLAILDAERGGELSLRPSRPGQATATLAYLPDTLVLRSTWEAQGGRLLVEDALTWDRPLLVRTARAAGADVEVTVRWRPAPDAARARTAWTLGARRATATAGGLTLHAALSEGDWRAVEGGRTMEARVTVRDGASLTVVVGDTVADAAAAQAAVAATRALWEALAARVAPATGRLRPMAVRAAGEAGATRALTLAALVLTGLRQREGAIVAAPTTSLPQWPGSSRTWDYRYAWPRDTALAALALLRLGLTDDAAALGEFCGQASRSGDPPTLLRVDGTAAPEEVVLPHLAGHGGARPVRIGNGAAAQAQLDVAGEVVDLAHALHRCDALGPSLRAAVPRLAAAVEQRWRLPDHGIWEIRGRPRRYTHSRVMAWTALRRAAGLARAGAVAGDADRWEAAAAEVMDALPAAPHALTLHDEDGTGGGPDAALTLLPLLGMLPCADPRVTATLNAIEAGLSRGGLLERHLGSPDGNPDPCAPFLFPTLWLASARDRCGGDGAPHLATALATAGTTGLLGEVADPVAHTPLGNYPQVQSHAALVLAALPPLHRR